MIKKQTALSTGTLFASILTGLLIMLLPVLDMPEMFDSPRASKFIVFSYAVCTAAGFHLLSCIFLRFRLSITRLDVFLFVLLAFITLNRYCLQPEYNYSIRYYELLGLAALYIVLRTVKPPFYYLFIFSIMAGGFIQALHGQLQLLEYIPSNHSYFNITGGFLNPGPYGGYLASVFPIALGTCFFYKDFLERHFYVLGYTIKFSQVFKILAILTIAFILLVLPSTQSRGAWLGVICSSVYLLFHKYQVHMDKWLSAILLSRKKIIGLVLLISISTALVLFLYTYKKESSDGRLLIWKVTLSMIKNKPLLGEGFDRFESSYMHFQANYFRSHFNAEEALVADNVTYAFNELLQFISENGLPAGLVLLFILVLVLNSPITSNFGEESGKRRTLSPLALMARAGIISTITFALFSYPAQILPIKLNALVYLVILSSYCSKVNLNLTGNLLPKVTYVKIVFITVALAILIFTGKSIGSLTETLIKFNSAVVMYDKGRYKDAKREFAMLYPLLNNSSTYLAHYGKALSMCKEYHKAVIVLQRAARFGTSSFIQTSLGNNYKVLKNTRLSEKAYVEAHYMTPGRLYPMYLLAKLYHESGQLDKAHAIAQFILKKKVKIDSLAVEEIKKAMEEILSDRL